MSFLGWLALLLYAGSVGLAVHRVLAIQRLQREVIQKGRAECERLLIELGAIIETRTRQVKVLLAERVRLEAEGVELRPLPPGFLDYVTPEEAKRLMDARVFAHEALGEIRKK